MKSSPPPFVRELVCFQLPDSFGEACLPSTATELGVTLTRTCLVLLLPAIALEMSWNDLIDNEDQMSRASISSSQRGHLHLLQPLPPVAVDSLERNMHALSTQTMAISDLMTSVVSGVAQGQRSRDHASAVRPTVSRRLHSMRALPPAPTSWMLQNINGIVSFSVCCSVLQQLMQRNQQKAGTRQRSSPRRSTGRCLTQQEYRSRFAVGLRSSLRTPTEPVP